MNKVLTNTIHLKDWMVIPDNGGVTSNMKKKGGGRQVEITRDNNLRALSLDLHSRNMISLQGKLLVCDFGDTDSKLVSLW